MKRYNNKILSTLTVLLLLLALPFCFGGCFKGEVTLESTVAETYRATEKEIIADEASVTKESPKEYKETDRSIINEEEKKPIADEQPLSTEPSDVIIKDENTCTLSVRCDKILENRSLLKDGVEKVIPDSGVIYAEKTVIYEEGESVFDLLVREMKQNGIHLEFENVTLYESAYIEGIANIYQFDCGELSGWIYMVNGKFPDCGCSDYIIKKGDRIEWVYSCELGADLVN